MGFMLNTIQNKIIVGVVVEIYLIYGSIISTVIG